MLLNRVWQTGFTATRSQTHTNRCRRSVNTQAFLKNVEANTVVPTKLNKIRDNDGARKKAKVLGRGPGSGKGKTSGRGHKGRKARSGGTHPLGFEGGGTPYYRSVRKYGFKNFKAMRTYHPVNLDRIQHWIDQGRLDPTKKITMKALRDTNCIGRLRGHHVGVKLLSEGREWFSAKVDLEVSQASARAIGAIEQNGGSVRLVYYNKLGLKHVLHPEKCPRPIYYPPPPFKVNEKLIHPMEQPDQNPAYKGPVLEKDKDELKHTGNYKILDDEEPEQNEESKQEEAEVAA